MAGKIKKIPSMNDDVMAGTRTVFLIRLYPEKVKAKLRANQGIEGRWPETREPPIAKSKTPNPQKQRAHRIRELSASLKTKVPAKTDINGER